MQQSKALAAVFYPRMEVFWLNPRFRFIKQLSRCDSNSSGTDTHVKNPTMAPTAVILAAHALP